MAKNSTEKQLNSNGNKRGMHPNSRKNLEKRSSWQKGESGNPNGKPKKDACITSLIKEMLDQKADYIIPGATPADGDKTWRQLIAKAILIGCVKGNTSLIGELLDRLEGKVSQPLETPLGKPFAVKVIEKVKDYGNGD
jgi:hypothetical protein